MKNLKIIKISSLLGISSEHFNVLRLPETFIINKNLEITKKIIGSEAWLDGRAEKFIKRNK